MAETNGENRNEDGTFGKGNPGKPKGATTKVSTKVKEAIVGFLEANVDQIQEDFDTLKPQQRLEFIASILPYAAPKLSSVASENKHEMTVTVQFRDAE